MFFYLLFNRKLFWDKYLKLYSIFITCFIVSSALGGYIDNAIKDILSLHFVGIIGYIATARIFRSHNGHKILALTIISIGILNSIVTISQLLHLNIATDLVYALHLSDGFTALTENISAYDEMQDSFLISIPGIFSDPVTNGYFSSVAAIMSMWLLLKYNKQYFLLITTLLLVGCFATQQRTAFISSIILSALIFYFYLKYGKTHILIKIIPAIIIIISLMIYMHMPTSNIETRYDNLLDMETRTNVYAQSISYISNNFALGGFYEFLNTYNKHPHNFIFNAIIYAGIIGAFCVFLIVWKHIKNCIYIIKNNPMKMHAIVPACLIISMLGSSLFHNQSIIFGDFLYLSISSFFTAYPNINHK